MPTMTRPAMQKGSRNVFRDLGFSAGAAEELVAKSALIDAISETIERSKLTQKAAAELCAIDQPTLSKVLRGAMESVTIDRLAAWLIALGRTVEIHVRPYNARNKSGHLVVVVL